MSHFSVIVVTPVEPDNVLLAEALQPYHEFESTGVVDKYVISKNITAEARTEYEKDADYMVKSPTGKLISSFDDQFYREPTEDELKKIGICGSGCTNEFSYSSRDWQDGKGYRAKVHFIPEGYTETKVPVKDLKSFREFIVAYYDYSEVMPGQKPDLQDKNKYGWVRMNKKGKVKQVIDRTNPNKQWDWWSIGGRFDDKLLYKTDVIDEWGLTIPDRTKVTKTNSAKKSTIDFDAMLMDEKQRRQNCLDQVLTDVSRSSGKTKEELLALHKEAVAAKPILLAEWRALDDNSRFWDYVDSKSDDNPLKQVNKLNLWDCFHGFPEKPCTLTDPYEWVAQAEPLTAYALVMDGLWQSNGDMGWWGISSNEKSDWDDRLQRLISGIPDNYWLTIVDCHI